MRLLLYNVEVLLDPQNWIITPCFDKFDCYSITLSCSCYQRIVFPLTVGNLCRCKKGQQNSHRDDLQSRFCAIFQSSFIFYFMVSRYDFSRGVIKCHISREIWKVYRQATKNPLSGGGRVCVNVFLFRCWGRSKATREG